MFQTTLVFFCVLDVSTPLHIQCLTKTRKTINSLQYPHRPLIPMMNSTMRNISTS